MPSPMAAPADGLEEARIAAFRPRSAAFAAGTPCETQQGVPAKT